MELIHVPQEFRSFSNAAYLGHFQFIVVAATWKTAPPPAAWIQHSERQSLNVRSASDRKSILSSPHRTELHVKASYSMFLFASASAAIVSFDLQRAVRFE